MWISLINIIFIVIIFLIVIIWFKLFPAWYKRRDEKMKKIAQDFGLHFWSESFNFSLFYRSLSNWPLNPIKARGIEGNIHNHHIEIYDCFYRWYDLWHTVIKIDGKAIHGKGDIKSFRFTDAFFTSAKKIRKYLENI
jgi:hypothetical protein